MIKHVVLFKLKERHEETLAEATKILLSMKDSISYIKEIEVGTDFLKSPRSFDLYLSVVLESRDMLDVYQADEYHCDIVKAYMNDVSEKSICIDFEI